MKQTLKRIIRNVKSINGNSLAEFATTTALMATLAATAAPKLSEMSEGTKAEKSMNEIDKILTQARNFYQDTANNEGRGRFPGQLKYNETVPATGAYATEVACLAAIKGDNATFTLFSSSDATSWASVFGTSNADAPAPSSHQISLTENPVNPNSFDEYVGAEEFLNEFGGNAVKSPFQDGHYIYTVIAGSGSGTSSVSPILFIADLESARNFHKKLQP